jgi:hypothetical protein
VVLLCIKIATAVQWFTRRAHFVEYCPSWRWIPVLDNIGTLGDIHRQSFFVKTM